MAVALVKHAGAKRGGAGRIAMNVLPAFLGRIVKTCATLRVLVTGGAIAPGPTESACAMRHGRASFATFMLQDISAGTRIRISRARGRFAVVLATVCRTEPVNARRRIRVNSASYVRREEPERNVRWNARRRQTVHRMGGAITAMDNVSAMIRSRGPHAASVRPEASQRTAWSLAAGTQRAPHWVDAWTRECVAV